MLQTRNYTIAADTTKSLRPDKDCPDVVPEEPSSSKPKKIPRQFDPKIVNVVTLDKATRNQMKYRYRIIIGKFFNRVSLRCTNYRQAVGTML